MTKKKAKPAAAAEQPAPAQFDPDQPRPADLSRFPLTKEAHTYLQQEQEVWGKDPVLWNRLIEMAKERGRQLRKEEVEGLLKEEDDDGAPSGLFCVYVLVDEEGIPKMTKTSRGFEPVLCGQRIDQPKRWGNLRGQFLPTPWGVKAYCRQHAIQTNKQQGKKTLPFKDAELKAAGLRYKWLSERECSPRRNRRSPRPMKGEWDPKSRSIR